MRHLSFVSFGAENGRPPFDPQDPVEHFYQVRDLWASGKSRFEAVLLAPIGRNFPPTILLRSLLRRESVPLLLEWPGGLFPSVALQCQFILLLALAGERDTALRLAEKLAPIVLGGFWTLWTLEKEYKEEETTISCALFLRAIGHSGEANFPYPRLPFFARLYNAAINIPITSPIQPFTQIVWTLRGSRSGLGAMRIGSVQVLAFGPHAYPLNNPHLFGISEAGAEWFCSSAQKEVWFQIQRKEAGFALCSLGVSFDLPMAFVFYIKAEECQVGERFFKPRSLQRFVGETSEVYFDGQSLTIDHPLKIEVIPLAGDQSDWGATFLLAFWLSPLSNKIFFRF